MRKAILTLLLIGVFCAIASIFWYQEMQYLLPTPIPRGYRTVSPKEIIRFDSVLLPQQHTRAKLLHFFSPDCPCSRFNLKHFHALYKKYGRAIDFYVVVPDKKKLSSVKYMVDKGIPVVVDKDDQLARACGVYSTPQAALIKRDNSLYFRGNYNRSRWCTDRNSNFVQMAMDSLLVDNKPPTFIDQATQSYGCSIDKESKVSMYP